MQPLNLQSLLNGNNLKAAKTVVTLSKDIFLIKFKTSLDGKELNVKANLKYVFKNVGIHPINKEEVVKRLSSNNVSVNVEDKHLPPFRTEKMTSSQTPINISVTTILQYPENQKNQKNHKKKET